MAQINWVLIDGNGGRHRIGLYHGDRTGHVMVHCNMKIIQIDFSVKESRMYSFFIEEELVELILDKKDGVFGYELRMNKKVDTPMNRIRRLQEQKTRKSMLLLGGGIVLLLAIMFFGLRWFGVQQEAKRMASTGVVSHYSKANMQRLAAEGKRTTARLHRTQDVTDGKIRINYTLLAVDSLMEQGDFQVNNTEPLLLPSGLPLSEGDAFDAIYLPDDPKVHRVDFFQPSRQTVGQYIRLATEAEQRAHPTDPPERVVCRVLTVAEKSGWTSLGHFIFQQYSKEQHSKYNESTYQRLMSTPEVLEALRTACPQ